MTRRLSPRVSGLPLETIAKIQSAIDGAEAQPANLATLEIPENLVISEYAKTFLDEPSQAAFLAAVGAAEASHTHTTDDITNLAEFIRDTMADALTEGPGITITADDAGDTITIEAGAGFLPAPDQTDETDATFFYFGWENVGGDWLVQRQTRSTGVSVSATGSNNPSYADLTAAFPDRAILTYA